MATRSEGAVFAAGMLAWLATALITVVMGAPLGHDEAQYALAGKDLVSGNALRWNYLSQGMLAVSSPGILAGGSELAMRAMPLLVGLAFVLASANLARRTTSPATAAWTVAVMAASIAMAKRNAELLSDMPAATGLVVGATILVVELTREGGLRWRLVLAAPALAAAFYLRYGSVVPIAIIGMIALVGGLGAIRRRPLPVVLTVLAFAALLVPHLLVAHAITGDPLGILLQSSSVPGAAYMGVGLVTYLTSNPLSWYGLVTTPVLLLGLVSIARARDRRHVMLWAMAVANVVGIGFTAIAQPRYIYFSLVVFIILGVDLVRGWFAAHRARTLVAVLAIAASWIAAVVVVLATIRARPARIERTLSAAAAIRSDAGGRACKVICRQTTQIEWYSGCMATLFVATDELPATRYYVVNDGRGADQPKLDELPGRKVPVLERADGLRITRVEP